MPTNIHNDSTAPQSEETRLNVVANAKTRAPAPQQQHPRPRQQALHDTDENQEDGNETNTSRNANQCRDVAPSAAIASDAGKDVATTDMGAAAELPPPPQYEASSEKIVYPAELDQCEAIEKTKVKTVLCINYMHGRRCIFGSHCAFAHGEAELRAPTEEMIKKKAMKEQEKQARLELLKKQAEEEEARLAAENLPPPPAYREPKRQGGRGGGRRGGRGGRGGRGSGAGRGGRGGHNSDMAQRSHPQRQQRPHANDSTSEQPSGTQ